MTKKPLILITIASCGFIALQSSFAATIPAGTTLVVETLTAIHSNSRVGRPVGAKLSQDVAVNGTVVLRAGTKVSAQIASSPTDPKKTRPLTVNITDVSVNGQRIPIKTASGFTIDYKGHPMGRGPSKIPVSSGQFVVPAGTKMEFRLAEPLNV
jgi:hypothetical protein